MTGDILQTRRTIDKPAIDKNQLRLWLLTCAIALLVVTMSGCQQLGKQARTELPIPDPILDTSQLDNVRFQSPQQAPGGGGQAGTPGMLNRQSHRLKLDGPVINVEESSDQSQLISAVNFRGNTTLQTHQLRRNIATRPGRFYDPDKLQQDVQQLWKMPEIARVNGPYIEQRDDGVIVTFDIEERNTVAKVEFIGNRGVDDRTLRKESGLDEIGHLDVHRIRMNRVSKNSIANAAFHELKLKSRKETKQRTLRLFS